MDVKFWISWRISWCASHGEKSILQTEAWRQKIIRFNGGEIKEILGMLKARKRERRKKKNSSFILLNEDSYSRERTKREIRKGCLRVTWKKRGRRRKNRSSEGLFRLFESDLSKYSVSVTSVARIKPKRTEKHRP